MVLAVPVFALAMGVGRPLLLLLAAAALVAALAAQAEAGLTIPEQRSFDGFAQLVGDPVESLGALTVDVRTTQGRFQLWARGAQRTRISMLGAGDRVHVAGDLSPMHQPMESRHLRARLELQRIDGVLPRTALVGLVGIVRSWLERGASVLPESQRTLFLGFVIGDARGGSAAVANDFEGAGLSHLLVVSGENLLFLMAIAAPVLSHLGLRRRVLAVALLLALFAAVTRFQPSVLRAVAMAAVAAVGVAIGRRVVATRVLCLAIASLLVVDPMLVHSLGFQLSVAATVGIVLVARRIADRVPGPRSLGLALGVTLAAQLAVAPILIPRFGPQPLVAIPANVLAEPVAGLVMMWGSSAGLLAGPLGPMVATLIHLPTRLGLWWVGSVARVAAHASLGRIGLVSIVSIVAAVVTAGVVRRRHRRSSAALLCVAAAILLWSVRPPSASPGSVDLGGAALWVASDARRSTVLIVDGDARVEAILQALARRGINHLDLLVSRSSSRTAADAITEIRSRVGIEEVISPSMLGGAPGSRSTEVLDVGSLHVQLVAKGARLQATISDRSGEDGSGRG